MTFLMGWSILAVGTLLASIPILIHLLHRQRTTPIQWGAMQFLLESPLQSKRRKKVEHWLLLALRTLALLLLAWLLARPLTHASRYNPLAAKLPADIAVVLDHSLSTGRRTGDHTVFDEARGVADQVARSMRTGDTLSVVLAEHRPRALNTVPAGANDTARLLQNLHQLQPGSTDCSIPEAVQSARELLAHGRNVRKLVVVASDERKNNWQIGDAAAWALAIGNSRSRNDHALEVHALPLHADPTASDIGIGEVTIEPRLVGINRPIQITAAVTNYGPKEAAGINIHLTIDGQEVGTPSRLESLGVGQTLTVRFDHTFSSAGSHWIKVWTEVVDALSADNSAVASAYVWQKLPVLIIDGQLTRAGSFNGSQFLQAAMQPVDPTRSMPTLIEPKVVSVADSMGVSLDGYYMVVLNDVPQLPPELEGKLIDYVDAGHGVWVILGPRTQQRFITGTLGPEHTRLAKLTLKEASPHNATPPAALDIKSAVNPMIAMIASSEHNALAGAVVTRWWAIEPRDGDDQVVLAAASGDPLVFEHPVGSNGGRVAVWCTSADGAWNNWPVMPNFVPLVNETVYHLCAAQTRGQSNGSVPAGSAIAWSGPGSPEVKSIDVTLPDGAVERGRKPLFRNGHWDFQYPNAFEPGLYQLRFDPTGVPQPVFYGVGIDRRELDPATLADKDHRWLSDNHFVEQTSGDQLAALIARDERGTELWKWLAAFVLVSLVMETVLTYRMIGRQKTGASIA